VTGSSGKTTTKELIGAILSKSVSTMVSKGNLNSEIGVPLSVFDIHSGHVDAVFEMGINHENEMDILASIVKPDLAVITNIGSAHIGILGSQEKIAEEKRTITKYFTGTEALFLFEEERFYDHLSKNVNGNVIRYGPKSTQGIKGSKNLGLDGTAIDWEGLRIRFPLVGIHNYHNALAAISVATYLKIPPEYIKAGLEGIKPLFGRSEIIPGKINIIKDCYNANPDSMEKALVFLSALSWAGRKIAVLGSMCELGWETKPAHRAIGKLAGGLNLDKVFFYGTEMADALNAFREESNNEACEGYTDFNMLAERVTEELADGDLVLVKGSRAMELEKLIPLLQKAEVGGGNG
jgi:UDP-N-acetylmuramoyl-tripeptide--D-alanyl-D-alanine ligase